MAEKFIGNEHLFELDNRTYVATSALAGHSCAGCAFEHNNALCYSAPACSPKVQRDWHVIFVERRQP